LLSAPKGAHKSGFADWKLRQARQYVHQRPTYPTSKVGHIHKIVKAKKELPNMKKTIAIHATLVWTG